MDTKRYAEHFFCDAARLASYLGGEKATISDGIGPADDFPLTPKDRSQVDDDVRFLRVDGEEYYEIAYVTSKTPTPADAKYRNKSLYRVMLGREIKKARESMGITITDLSKRTNLRDHSLLRIEEGRWDIDIALLGVILDALNKEIKIV